MPKIDVVRAVAAVEVNCVLLILCNATDNLDLHSRKMQTEAIQVAWIVLLVQLELKIQMFL